MGHDAPISVTAFRFEFLAEFPDGFLFDTGHIGSRDTKHSGYFTLCFAGAVQKSVTKFQYCFSRFLRTDFILL